MFDFLTPVVIGLHLVSVHLPAEPWQNNVNPGVYVRSASGLTVGAYRNTLSRPSIYIAQSFELAPEGLAPLRFALTVGVVSGYRIKRVDQPCPPGTRPDHACYTLEGLTNAHLLPMLTPSVSMPLGGSNSLRLSFIPSLASRSSVFHLSAEHSF